MPWESHLYYYAALFSEHSGSKKACFQHFYCRHCLLPKPSIFCIKKAGMFETAREKQSSISPPCKFCWILSFCQKKKIPPPKKKSLYFYSNGFLLLLGIHYVGEMHKNGMMRVIMDQLTDGQLDWAPMENPYDVISVGGREYNLCSRRETFAKELERQFPEEKEAIKKFMRLSKVRGSRGQ